MELLTGPSLRILVARLEMVLVVSAAMEWRSTSGSELTSLAAVGSRPSMVVVVAIRRESLVALSADNGLSVPHLCAGVEINVRQQHEDQAMVSRPCAAGSHL